MSDTTKSYVQQEQATMALNEVACRADALSAAWDSDNLPPNLAEFLPESPPALRQMVLIELIKIDLEYRWQQHELPKQIEEYCEEFPELVYQGEIPHDIIYEEYHVRAKTDDAPAPEDYYKRFPRQAKQLERMMSLDPNKACSTTLIGGGGGAQRAAEIDVGQQIDDFDLFVQLGKGSFGSVYLARQRSMQRLVALKISRDKGAEPQTLAQLDHPHIVRVYDQRVLVDRKLQLMYMQHIAGGTLGDVQEISRQSTPALRTGKIFLESIDRSLDKQGDSPPTDSGLRRRLANYSWPEAVCWIGSRLAAALEYAHNRGVLHRDIKPANVLLAADGSPKLVDFNVSYSSKLEGASAGAFFGGSLAYMSPEQVEAYNPDHDRLPDELDGRSDIYSLGIVLWELLTGSRPFADENFEGTWQDRKIFLERLAERRHAGITENTWARLPTNMPSGLKEVLASCLAPKVEDRPANAGSMARQLELCLQPRLQSLLRPAVESRRQWLRRKPVTWFIVVGLLPSVLFSVLNWGFNHDMFINATVKPFFERVEVPVINGIMFPIAIILVLSFTWPILTAIRRTIAGERMEVVELAAVRRRALWIGDFVAWLGMGLWTITGISFPTWLYFHFGAIDGAGFPQFRNFLVSQITTGAISSTLTFFLLTYTFVKVFYPILVSPENPSTDDVTDLARLERRSNIAFYLAVIAAFAALLLVAFFGAGDMQTWMAYLTAIGFACCALAFFLLQGIRTDLNTLATVVDPQHESASLGGGDTVGSFFSSTR